MFLNALQWFGKRFVSSIYPKPQVEEIEQVEHADQPIPFRQSEHEYGWDSADTATTRTSSAILFHRFFHPRTIGEVETILPFHTNLIDDGSRLPTNPNDRTTRLRPAKLSGPKLSQVPCWVKVMMNRLRHQYGLLELKPKKPKTLRRTTNRKADAKRYGEAVDHMKRFSKSEAVYQKPVEPTGNSLTTPADIARRSADGLADYLATFEDGGLRWLALHDPNYRQPSKFEARGQYDEHGDLNPLPTLSLGRLGKRCLSKRNRKRLEIAKDTLGDVASMLAAGYLQSEIADSLSVSQSAISQRIGKAKRLGNDVPADTLPAVWRSSHRFDLPLYGPEITASGRMLAAMAAR